MSFAIDILANLIASSIVGILAILLYRLRQARHIANLHRLALRESARQLLATRTALVGLVADMPDRPQAASSPQVVELAETTILNAVQNHCTDHAWLESCRLTLREETSRVRSVVATWSFAL